MVGRFLGNRGIAVNVYRAAAGARKSRNEVWKQLFCFCIGVTLQTGGVGYPPGDTLVRQSLSVVRKFQRETFRLPLNIGRQVHDLSGYGVQYFSLSNTNEFYNGESVPLALLSHDARPAI